MKEHVGREVRPVSTCRTCAHSAGRLGWVLAVFAFIAVLCVSVFLTGCGSTPLEPEDDAHLNIASLKGPTSVGLVPLMVAEADETTASGLYSFDVEGTADAIVPKIVQGQVDIALIPANLAAILYQKTQGGITVIDVNTLGVLSAVSQAEVGGVADLAGKTVYMTGKGTVPQYTLDALLAANELTESDLKVEFKSEPAEVVAAISKNKKAIGILPQPYATAAVLKNRDLSVKFSLTDEWDAAMGEDAGKLVTGVTVVRNEVLEQYPQAVKVFLADHLDSVNGVTADPEGAAPAVVAAGIVENEALAAAAIPDCNIVCLTGEEMKNILSGYLSVLEKIAPEAIGGQLPADDFYYVG